MIKCPSCGSEVFETDRFCRNCGAMLELSVIFEAWHLADGNYPPFYKGMVVNLSFQVNVESALSSAPSEKHYSNHLGDAEYDFYGEVIYKETPLEVFDVGNFRF